MPYSSQKGLVSTCQSVRVAFSLKEEDSRDVTDCKLIPVPVEMRETRVGACHLSHQCAN